ncbi:MAG: hypothetical protein V1743_07730 [Nanoarchaeota archaeon]
MKSIITKVKTAEKKLSALKKKCIICNAAAHYAVKGQPHQTYCKECALDSFKHLNYLEKIETPAEKA